MQRSQHAFQSEMAVALLRQRGHLIPIAILRDIERDPTVVSKIRRDLIARIRR